MRLLVLLVLMLEVLAVASFNVQVFGASKMSTPGVAPVLVDIIRRYDFIFIQEIRDSTGQAILDLWSMVNSSLASNQQYSLIISDRLGRTASKEQYAYFYKPSLVQILSSYQYPEAADLFERPPFSVHIKFASLVFGVIGCHVSPDDAVIEMSNLNLVHAPYLASLTGVQVAGAVKSLWNEPRLLLMGDFNAGCGYVSTSDWPNVSLRQLTNYTWLISDTTDTTNGATLCPYDRFVVTNELLPSYVQGTATSFDYGAAYSLDSTLILDISDHKPIEMTLQSSGGSGGGKKSNAGVVAGVVIAVLVVVAIVAVVAFILIQKRRGQKSDNSYQLTLN